MSELCCPYCGERLIRPARDGGTLLKNRYVRVTDAEPRRVLVGCPKCPREIAVGTSLRGRLVLRPPSRP